MAQVGKSNYKHPSGCVQSHRVSCAVRRGAFAPRDAEPEPLVVADQAGGQPLPRPAGTLLHVEGDAAAASLPGEVVVLRPERRGGDGVLRLHHALTQHRHGNRSAGAAEGFHRRVVFCFVEVYAVHLRHTMRMIKMLNRVIKKQKDEFLTEKDEEETLVSSP